MREPILKALSWYQAIKLSDVDRKVVPTRDQLQAKLNNIYSDFSSKVSEDDLVLLTAVVGEIGNNCFDHNLGQWRDIAGCWLDYGLSDQTAWVCVSDRGQGVFASLKNADPTLQNDQEALETAFQKVISGRSPERRGNGLKFVRSIINGNKNRGLIFISGEGKVSFGGQADFIYKFIAKNIQSYNSIGTFAVIVWREEK